MRFQIVRSFLMAVVVNATALIFQTAKECCWSFIKAIIGVMIKIIALEITMGIA